MFSIVLVQPEIPPNTGNVIRLCANTGCALHLIEPLGFAWEDAQLRRAGLDYHEFVDVRRHASLEACRTTIGGSGDRWFAMTTKGETPLPAIALQPGDVFVFGRESSGLAEEQLAIFPKERRLRLPMRPGQRSLNLSNAVAVTVFEAWRQSGFSGAV
jgi:tRNA (cytidine/uridine-2'-O-)-methyltransferase